MTDKTFNSNVAGATDKLVDMGDGTFAHRVRADHATTGISGGNKTVATAGTAVTLKSTATPAKWIWIHAYTLNTGRIAIGGSNVNASQTIGTGTGGSLAAGDSVMLPINDISEIYIDATVSGEGVRYTYGT